MILIEYFLLDSDIKREINGLEEMNRQLFLELVDLNRTLERISFSKTLQGKYFNFVGYFFSIYCIWKIFISSINIIFDRVGKVDPVTRSIEIVVGYLGFKFDVQFWSQNISFLVVGIIVVTSIRGFLITLTKVNRNEENNYRIIIFKFVFSFFMPFQVVILPILLYCVWHK